MTRSVVQQCIRRWHVRAAIALASAPAWVLGACCSPLVRTYYPVHAGEFVAIYDAPRLKTLRWDSAEPSGIYAVLDHYSLGTGSWVEYTYSVFVLRSELPAGFPDHLQPEMITGRGLTECEVEYLEERVPSWADLATARGSVLSLP